MSARTPAQVAAGEIASKYLLTPTRATMEALERAYHGLAAWQESAILGRFRANRKIMAHAMGEARMRGWRERDAARKPGEVREFVEELNEAFDGMLDADNQRRDR